MTKERDLVLGRMTTHSRILFHYISYGRTIKRYNAVFLQVTLHHGVEDFTPYMIQGEHLFLRTLKIYLSKCTVKKLNSPQSN